MKKNENNPMHKEKTQIYKFMLSPRCGAKTKMGSACLSPAIRFKKRCRMHGGKGSGASKGSQNALKHGYFTVEAKIQRMETRAIIKEWKTFKDSL